MEAGDIDQAFDDIVLTDQIESDKGYKEGFEVGTREAEAVGFGLGFQRAAQLASEVGFYEGFALQAEAALAAAGPSSPASDAAQQQLRRARPLLLTLRRLVAQIPRHNTADSDVTAQLAAVRAKFRQLCAVLRVSPGSAAQQKEISF